MKKTSLHYLSGSFALSMLVGFFIFSGSVLAAQQQFANTVSGGCLVRIIETTYDNGVDGSTTTNVQEGWQTYNGGDGCPPPGGIGYPMRVGEELTGKDLTVKTHQIINSISGEIEDVFVYGLGSKEAITVNIYAIDQKEVSEPSTGAGKLIRGFGSMMKGFYSGIFSPRSLDVPEGLVIPAGPDTTLSNSCSTTVNCPGVTTMTHSCNFEPSLETVCVDQEGDGTGVGYGAIGGTTVDLSDVVTALSNSCSTTVNCPGVTTMTHSCNFEPSLETVCVDQEGDGTGVGYGAIDEFAVADLEILARTVSVPCLGGSTVTVSSVPNGVTLNNDYWCKHGSGTWLTAPVDETTGSGDLPYSPSQVYRTVYVSCSGFSVVVEGVPDGSNVNNDYWCKHGSGTYLTTPVGEPIDSAATVPGFVSKDLYCEIDSKLSVSDQKTQIRECTNKSDLSFPEKEAVLNSLK